MPEMTNPADYVGLAKAATTLISYLWDVKSAKEHNTLVAREVDLFVTSLNENIAVMKKMIPTNNSAWALESLEGDLSKAASYLENCLSKGYFRAMWDAKKIKDELESLRVNINQMFQIKVFITTFEVAVDGNKKMDDFQSKMLQLSALSAAHSDSGTTETQKLLRSVLVGMRRQDENLQSFVSAFRGSSEQFDSSLDTQKFIADVLACVEELTVEDSSNSKQRPPDDEEDLDEFYDRFTAELMCDPVKCNDGITYDRFSVFQYNLTQPKPLIILCDDVNMRGRLFSKFKDEGLDTKYRSRRNEYREQALQLAKKGHSREALGMLDEVLKWADGDTECLQMRQRLKDEISPKQANTSRNNPTMQAPPPEVPPGRRQDWDPESLMTTMKENESLLINALILVLCFPCSLCCLSCLCPNYCSKKGAQKDMHK